MVNYEHLKKIAEDLFPKQPDVVFSNGRRFPAPRFADWVKAIIAHPIGYKTISDILDHSDEYVTGGKKLETDLKKLLKRNGFEYRRGDEADKNMDIRHLAQCLETYILQTKNGLRADESSRQAQSIPMQTKRKQSRLKLDEPRKRFNIDGKWHDYRGDHAGYFLGMLLKAKGKWESGSNLVSATATRADRVFKSLPKPIHDVIDSQPGGTGGYRIKPEYFNLT